VKYPAKAENKPDANAQVQPIIPRILISGNAIESALTFFGGKMISGLVPHGGTATVKIRLPKNDGECLIRLSRQMKPFKILLLIATVWFGANSGFAQTWTQTSAPNGNWNSIASSADGSKLVAVAYPGLIYTSTNSGIDWTPTSAPFLRWASVASSADGAKLVAVGFWENSFPNAICTSTDFGVTWVQQTNAPNVGWNAVASSADGSKLVAAVFYGGIYTSTNSGVDWTSNSAPSEPWVSVASSADGTKLVAVAEANGIYTSTDSGVTWTQPANGFTNYYWYSIASSADGTKLVVGALSSVSGGFSPNPIFTSTNSGATWISNNVPNQQWQCVASSADGAKLVAMAYHGFIFTSTNVGISWTSNSVPGAYWSSIASSADGTRLVAADLENSAIWALQSMPSPSVNIMPTNGNIKLSWIVPSTNFVMQQSSDLLNWADMTNQPVLNLTNLQDEVILPPPGSNVFYRLKTP
jgi:hypothetical protein